ncbi:hypothetical protein CDL12_01378 [Handroanthus impetiginosus]|uniref:Uncharacterized protein n=1 Tax=Handroanthus impetiginosus TaxID=429701 RepID=A0A2G9I800_9LAMI|nr:hypothetical protein CDL12_01378 [Handroanthus impetiginosus]
MAGFSGHSVFAFGLLGNIISFMVQTVKLLVLVIACGMGFISVTHFLVKASQRAIIVGWICLIFSLCVFIAPLCIVRQVIRTKNVERMPFVPSLFLTLKVVMWFFYGLLLKDFKIAIPNILGFSFGVIQMVLYVMYKNAKHTPGQQRLPEIQKQTTILEEQKIPEATKQIIEIVSQTTQ